MPCCFLLLLFLSSLLFWDVALVWFVVVWGGRYTFVCFEVFVLFFCFPFPLGLGSLSGLDLGFCNEQRNAFVCLTNGSVFMSK